MKKFLTTFTIFILTAGIANAGIYVGADALLANAKHGSTKDLTNNDRQKNVKLNYGLNAGYRFDLLGFMAGAEIFYDNLQTSARDFHIISSSTNNNSNPIAVDNRYGTKVNIGFSFIPKITPFITYGLTNMSYSSNSSITGQLTSQTEKFVPIYGAGILIDVPLTGLSLKMSYDYQNFNMRYNGNSSKTRAYLGIAKLGLVYNF